VLDFAFHTIGEQWCILEQSEYFCGLKISLLIGFNTTFQTSLLSEALSWCSLTGEKRPLPVLWVENGFDFTSLRSLDASIFKTHPPCFVR